MRDCIYELELYLIFNCSACQSRFMKQAFLNIKKVRHTIISGEYQENFKNNNIRVMFFIS